MSNTWKNININKNLVKYNTANSTLIAMPSKSEYAGYEFWHPAKLVRYSYLGEYASNIGYTDGFVFHLKKYSYRTYKGFSVIAEKDISAAEFEKAFFVHGGVTNEPDIPLINMPEHKDPVEYKILEELKDE